jgi:hypothetical protein
MLALCPSVQPTSNLSRLVSGFASRRGALTRLSVLLLVCFSFAIPLQSAILPGPQVPPLLIAGHNLLEELPILLADPSPPKPAEVVDPRVASAERLFPPFRLRMGIPPRARLPQDGTAIVMFGSGMILFAIGWLIAAWERRPSVYRRPLYPGEAAPRPEPPHIIYSLTRIF